MNPPELRGGADLKRKRSRSGRTRKKSRSALRSVSWPLSQTEQMERETKSRGQQCCGMLVRDHSVRKKKDENQEPGTSPQQEGKNIAKMSASEAQHKSNEEAMPRCCSFLGVFSRKKKESRSKLGHRMESFAQVPAVEHAGRDEPLVPSSQPAAHPELKLLHGKCRQEFVQHTVLGEGMSCVYLATRKSTGAKSAVKMVSVLETERRLREFYILRQLDHPNVIRLLDAWQEGEMMYLETELCAMTLQHILEAKGDIPRQAWHQLVSGLAYLHSKDIVHRDLAPKNIFITESGQLKIGDLGLSKQLGNDHEAGNSPNHKLGAVVYNSGSAPSNDLKTDVHALGVLLLDMLLVKQETREDWVWSFSRQGVTPEVLKDPRNQFYFDKISALTSRDRDSRPTATAILEEESFWPLFDCSFADALKFS